MILEYINKHAARVAFIQQHALGIYFDKHRIEVAQVKRNFKTHRLVERKFYATDDQFLTQLNKDFTLKDKPVALNINSDFASYKLLKIPKIEPSEIKSWLTDNSKSFLPAGISSKEVTLSYKIVQQNSDMLILLAVLDKREITDILEKMMPAKATIAFVSPGALEWGQSMIKEGSGIQAILIRSEDTDQIIISEDGLLLYFNQIPKAFKSARNEQTVQTLKSLFEEDFHYLEFTPTTDNTYFRSLYITDNRIDTERLSPAYSLALSALTGKTDTLDFCPEDVADKATIFTWKQLFLKTVIGLGSIGICMYLLLFTLTMLMDHLLMTTRAEREALKPHLVQLGQLEGERDTYISNLKDSRSITHLRSKREHILSALAYHIPQGCWLVEMSYNSTEDNMYNTRIKGMSRERQSINQFLANLEGDNMIRMVKLEYANSLDAGEMYKDWKIRSGSYVTFLILLKI